ncbi:hypothetical protein MNBD_ALPHA03-1674 [hydrothermal vent metagenome]|uniref:HTH tetR-type domain-containing protein n=1 Tax=hydrothermal vent metagenome TaxID=652676 RepID=A0A3B1B359_9ZZZZ
MARKAKFSESDFILATINLITLGGPTAATMTAIAASAGAPTGSIYHRFKSRSDLLGAAWCHSLSSMMADIYPHLVHGNSDQAICALIDWAEANPALAHIIMLYDENDLIDDTLSPKFHRKLTTIYQKLGAGLSALIKFNQKPLTSANIALVNFAIFDGPIAAMKPYLRNRPGLKNRSGGDILDMSLCRNIALTCCQTSLELLE